MNSTIQLRAMVVDDEPMIRQLVSSVLSASGYSVLSAESSEHAVEMLESGPAVDLLLTDIMMPGENGCQLASRMVARRPGLRVLFMSAYEPGVLADSNIPGANFLRKPFHITELVDRVRKTLAL